LPKILAEIAIFLANTAWHGSCDNSGVKLSMDNFPMIGETDSQCRLRIRNHFVRNHRAQKRSGFWSRLFKGVRTMFVFMLLATLVTFVVVHQKDIQAAAEKEIHTVAAKVQNRAQDDPLRQKALDYENQVDAVVAPGR
jgi:hypothetical protein